MLRPCYVSRPTEETPIRIAAPRLPAWIVLVAGIAAVAFAWPRQEGPAVGVAAGLVFLLAWTLGAIPAIAAARAEQATSPLREDLERVRGVLDSALDGILTIDDRGMILTLNAASERIFGHKSAEVAGQKLTMLLSEECREEYAPGLGTRFRIGHDDIVGRVVELTGLRKDGTRVPIDLSIWEVRVLGKRVYTGIVRDITERKRFETALQDSNFRLHRALDELKEVQRELVQQERLRALGEMASGITHDFNNFLAPITGFTELLLGVPGSLDDREKARRYLELIQTSAKAAAGVVARLREFYRKRERSDFQANIDLNRLVGDVAELTQPKWRAMTLAKGIEIRVETRLAPALPTVLGNEAELRNVLTNLVFNAVDAMPKGGLLTLSTSHVDPEVVVEVRDTGTGMSEEVRKRCLEPFYTTKGDKGTGLGLSVAFGVIERHGGKLEIDSHVGAGTTIRIRLPIGGGGGEAASSPTAASASRPAHVLVVEDEEIIREMLGGYLQAAGHTVAFASNGREGIDAFRAGRFDLVVSDMAMPEMNGLQLAAALRREASPSPFLLLSGMGEQLRSEAGPMEGVDIVLSKPVTLAALTEAVAMLAARPR